MEMQRKQLAIEGTVRDLRRDAGMEGVPVLFWADLYGNPPFPIYLLFHACWRSDHSCWLPTEEAPT
jgi:hypothetical protein